MEQGSGTNSAFFGGVNFSATNLAVGSYVFYVTATSTAKFGIFGRNGSVFSITNISVIEITDDTNLPRINYEGFSYQDSLGSEEVVNGDFSDGETGWNVAYANTTLSINDNELRATANSTGAYGMSQGFSLNNGSTYRVVSTINVDNASGGTANLRIATSSNLGAGSITLSQVTGTTTTTFVAASDTMYIGIVDTADNSNNYVEIDNISVKEVTGQEVVPNSGCGSWLLEPQSTNLALNSNDLTNNSWNKFNSSASSSTIINPEGTSGASLYTCGNYTGANQYFRINPNTTYSNDVGYSYSMFVKYNTFQFCKLTYVNYNVEHFTAVFDIINGTVTDTDTNGTPQNTSSKIEDFGNNWFRISISAAISSSSGNAMNFEFNKTPSGTPTFDAFGRTDQTTTTNDKVYVYGAQLEQQSFATSYIPTSGASSTRLQDIATNSGNASLINSEEGVLYAEISAFISLEPVYQIRYITLTNNTSSQRIALLFGGNNNQLRAIAYSNTQNINLSFSTTLTEVKQFNKLAIKFKSGDYAFFLNGVKIGGSSEINIFSANTLNDLSFDVGGGTQKFFGKNKAVAVFKTALTDAQ